MYVHIADGQITDYAPPTLMDASGMIHYHPPRDMYVAAGWLEIVNVPAPEQTGGDTVYYVSSYTDDGSGNAVQSWITGTVPDPITPEPTIEERVTALETLYLQAEEII